MILTEKQQRVFDFIVQFRQEHGYSPSVGDIQRGLGYRSVPAALAHVRALEKKGRIRSTPGVARSIVVL